MLMLSTYSSPDLTDWKLETFYVNDNLTITPTKSVVRYSNTTNLYVMLLGNQQLTTFNYLTSRSPAGPWTDYRTLSGPYIGHDFDIAVAPNGDHWMLSDTFSNATVIPQPGLPTTISIAWDAVVQKLNPDLTSVPAQSNDTLRVIFSGKELADRGLTMEACAFFYRDGYYYMTFAQTCQYCTGFTYYFYSKGDPLGPYTDGGVLRLDGCGAQNKGANVLPSAQGDIVVGPALAYRTSPDSLTVNGLVAHANNNQALSQTFYWPLEFNDDHTMKPYTCPAQVRIPLATNITQSPAAPNM